MDGMAVESNGMNVDYNGDDLGRLQMPPVFVEILQRNAS